MKKKTIVIIILIAFVLSLLLVLILGSKKNNSYLILSKYYSFEYKNGKFVKANFDDLYEQKFAGFSNREFIGYYEIYDVDTNDEYYFTNDASDEAYLFDNPYLFVTDDVKVIEYEEIDASNSDLAYLNSELGLNIRDVDELENFKKVQYDIDQDGSLDYIYYATYFDENDINSFSCVFLVSKNKVYLMGLAELYEAYEESSIKTMDYFSLSYLLKIDGSIKMIVAMDSTDLTYYYIYGFDNKLVTDFGGVYA